MYPNLCSVITEMFICIDPRYGTKERRLFIDVDVVCFEGEHLNLVLKYCIPGFFIWILGIPYFIYSTL
jgi:hypothetical protein